MTIFVHSSHQAFSEGSVTPKSCGSKKPCRAFVLESEIERSKGNGDIGVYKGLKWGVPKCCLSILGSKPLSD